MKENNGKSGGLTAFLEYVIVLACLYYGNKYNDVSLLTSGYVLLKWIATIAALFIMINQIGAPKVHPKPKKEEKDNKKTDTVGIVLVLFCVAIFLPRIWRIFGTHGEISHNQEIVNQETKMYSFTYNFITTCIVAPLGEEVIFRYLPEKFLKNGFIFITISSVVFAWVHCFTSENPLRFMPTYIGVSILLGYVYYKTERLFFSVLTHFAFNFIGGGYLSHFLSR